MHMVRLVLSLVLAFGLANPAAAWWDEAWKFRTKVVLDTGAAGVTEPIGRTAVLVRLHTGNFTFADAMENGADIRVVAGDDKTPLKFHVEKFDGLVDEVAVLWVDVPDLAAGGQTPIYIYYGNAAATVGGDAKAVYGPETVGVFPIDPAAGAVDVTAYGNTLAGPAGIDANGIIAAGLRLDATQQLVAGPSASLASPAGGPVTLSLWVRPSAAGQTGTLAALNGVVGLALDAGAVRAVSTGAPIAGPILAPETWTHVAVRADGETVTLFVNGQPAGSQAGALAAGAGNFTVGGGFAGGIDQVKLVKAAVQPGAIQLAAVSEGVGSRLTVFNQPEQTGEAGAGYVGILFSSLTVDGWAVIGILAVMLLIAIWVMVTKAGFINRSAKANDRFLERTGGNAPLEKGAPLQAEPDSPLYRLHEIGRTALAERLAANDEPGAGLPSQSVAIVRSKLDTGLVRETQRLNRLMVLLTIAISGGPFLGLLGTVVGVMITFAAIAAAGDVNINSIAPGIAAALLATVAGLAVAIPALFGYNYLGSRINDIVADMGVYVDTLEKRIADAYRPGRFARKEAAE